jgi:hypothetical protein
MRVWQKALHREEWHRWFAWCPVEVGDTLVWLTWIERRRCYAVVDEWWEVRLPDGEGGADKYQSDTTRDRNGAKPWLFVLRTATP